MMRKNLLGRTGFLVSEIAFGAGVTGGILIKGDETGAVRALNRALAVGINWIDTAALYGNGASEATIGRHINSIAPQPYVSTKVRIERDEMHDIPGAIERSLTESLKRLDLERVALFQLHNQLGEAVGDRPVLSPEQVLGPDGVADTFDRLKEQGLFYASGMTATGETSAILEVIESARFDVAQVYYNAINPSAGWSRAHKNWRAQDFSGILSACFRQNMGVLNIRIFAGGPLAKPAKPERLAVLTAGTDVDNEVRCAAAVRAALGTQYGSPAQVALRFVLGNHDITSRIIGVGDVRDLEEAVKAVEAGPLPKEAVEKLERLWATDFRVS
ncbi:MAG: aldo/keto reductase [Xanthobacteraceae bacterium]|nr:aldo/keto reductase [Xanthobacteraceae bacterium]